MFGYLSRRDLFARAFAGTPLLRFLEASVPEAINRSRTQVTLELRKHGAVAQSKRPIAQMLSNGDENNLPNRIACFAMGLPQNQFGDALFPSRTQAVLLD